MRQIISTSLSTESLLDMEDEQKADVLRNDTPVENPRGGNLESLFPYFEQELARTGINRMMLLGEYKRRHADSYNYSRFCDHFRQWRQARQGTMHFDLEPGRDVYMEIPAHVDPSFRHVDPPLGR